MRQSPRDIIKKFKEVRSVRNVAEALGVHRATVYRWIKKARSYRGYLVERIQRDSTKPKTVHRKLSGASAASILTLRRTKGYTAEKIVRILNLPCSSITVHRFLKRRGLVRRYGTHRRPRFQDTVHMHLKNTPSVGFLQVDVKYLTPQLSGLPWTCFEYAVIDIYSRYKEAVILNQLDQDGTMNALAEIVPKLPFKTTFLQTDNGLEFQERFHQLCVQRGLHHHYVHKRTPNENAVIERSFRTDEEEFFFLLPRKPQHSDELREWFAAYLYEYNHIRPHLGIHLKTPSQVVAEVVID